MSCLKCSNAIFSETSQTLIVVCNFRLTLDSAQVYSIYQSNSKSGQPRHYANGEKLPVIIAKGECLMKTSPVLFSAFNVLWYKYTRPYIIPLKRKLQNYCTGIFIDIHSMPLSPCGHRQWPFGHNIQT